MNLLTRIRNYFNPRPLRNKPGEMAWITNVLQGADCGERQLNGRAVRCVRVVNGKYWVVEPPQSFVCTYPVVYVRQGIGFNPGSVIDVASIADECLIPWKEDGVSDSEVRDLYAPESKREILALPVREM